jgi:hypothetical protein
MDEGLGRIDWRLTMVDERRDSEAGRDGGGWADILNILMRFVDAIRSCSVVSLEVRSRRV